MFVKKAEFGARMALNLINERDQHPAATPTAAVAAHAPSALRPASTTIAKRGTLQANDLEPAWRGKAIRTGG